MSQPMQDRSGRVDPVESTTPLVTVEAAPAPSYAEEGRHGDVLGLAKLATIQKDFDAATKP